jgi:hypothetical protein
VKDHPACAAAFCRRFAKPFAAVRAEHVPHQIRSLRPPHHFEVAVAPLQRTVDVADDRDAQRGTGRTAGHDGLGIVAVSDHARLAADGKRSGDDLQRPP